MVHIQIIFEYFLIMSFDNIKQLNQQFEDIVQKNDLQNTAIPEIVKKLKLIIYTNPNLAKENPEFIAEACKFAENNVLFSLKNNNIDQFHRAIQKLDFFYDNFPELQKTKNYYELSSLILINLLSLNQTKDFYTELQTFQGEELNNKYLQYVIELNQSIEDGNYRYVFELRNSSPSPLYKPFLQRIQETVRNEIARSSESAYNSLSFAQAVQIFQLENQGQIKEFVQKVSNTLRNDQIKWNVDTAHKRIIFENASNQKPSINSSDLLRKALRYAQEIERIV